MHLVMIIKRKILKKTSFIISQAFLKPWKQRREQSNDLFDVDENHENTRKV